MYLSGSTLRDIAAQIGVTAQSVSRWARSEGWRADETAQLASRYRDQLGEVAAQASADSRRMIAHIGRGFAATAAEAVEERGPDIVGNASQAASLGRVGGELVARAEGWAEAQPASVTIGVGIGVVAIGRMVRELLSDGSISEDVAEKLLSALPDEEERKGQ